MERDHGKKIHKFSIIYACGFLLNIEGDKKRLNNTNDMSSKQLSLTALKLY